MLDNDVLVKFEDSDMMTINSPIWIDGSPKKKPRLPPGIGQHSDEVLRGAGNDLNQGPFAGPPEQRDGQCKGCR